MKKTIVVLVVLLGLLLVGCSDFTNPLNSDITIQSGNNENGSGNNENGSGNNENGSGNNENGSGNNENG